MTIRVEDVKEKVYSNLVTLNKTAMTQIFTRNKERSQLKKDTTTVYYYEKATKGNAKRV